jgi:polyferredoxin
LTLTRARRIVQGLFLALFLFLFIQTESKGTDELGWPVKLFLDFDPLIFLTTFLASHRVEGLFWLSLILVGLTVVLGRFFCGWVCPLGTLNNFAGSLRKKKPKPPRPGWFRIKYYVLIGLFASSLFGVQLAGVLDPISLTIRSFSLALYPAASYVVVSLFDAIYRIDLPLVTPPRSRIRPAEKTVLPSSSPGLRRGPSSAALPRRPALNLVQRRFWCRFLCPWGRCWGSCRAVRLRRSVSEECDSCGACVEVCQADAVPAGKDGGGPRNASCATTATTCARRRRELRPVEGAPQGGSTWGEET